MRRNRSSLLALFPEPVRARFHFPISTAIRRALASGYDRAAFKADVLAGMVVGIVALPLCMALAIAVGVPPQHGLYTAIVAGIVVALTGGSKFQVTGPTAAFVVILAPIASRHGLSGLLTAGLMAGVLLVAMGAARLGKLIQFIPHPVTTGFTAGIATVIATLQLKDALGLSLVMPETYLEKVVAIWNARAETSLPDVCAALATIAILIALPKWRPGWTARVPAPLVAMVLVSLGVLIVCHLVPSIHVATLGSRFQFQLDGQTVAGIPAIPPTPILPWGSGGLSLGALSSLGSAAFAIAMLGAIESLLSAVVADGMTGKRHDPDAELIGLGLGNIVAPFFGGIAATGALARTATNVRAGARSPFSAVTHSVVVLLAVVLLAPLLAHVPMAALAGLLLVVAWNMSEVRHFATTMRIAPKSDVFVLLTCYVLTVVFDMVIAVSVGIVLASLLFMKRTAEVTHSRLLEERAGELEFDLPPGVAVYEVAGPLFFGAAQNAMGALQNVSSSNKVVVLALGHVPSIDATGLVALESALARLKAAKKLVVVSGPLPEPRRVFDRASLPDHHDHLYFADTFTAGLALARRLAGPEHGG
ncbi:MAG TPA: C4-dicarboxylic acid transporter DauA [Polyangiaceae bacterium]|jgi:SulP family sulfate permease|nr:C4-dicarboxylic acid transporter DauA [Polyangiaceae bacterium]